MPRESYTFTDDEAAAILAWAHRQPRHPVGNGAQTFAGVEGAAAQVGLKRVHLAFVLSPTRAKRRALGVDSLALLVARVVADDDARTALRRVASDHLHEMMDEAIRADAEREQWDALVRAGEGVMVRLIPI